MNNITIIQSQICKNPRCVGGQIARNPAQDLAEAHGGYADLSSIPGGACPECGGRGRIEKILSHEEYMDLVLREEQEEVSVWRELQSLFSMRG
jgi:hypothetical protein